jgi:hypothetical protein
VSGGDQAPIAAAHPFERANRFFLLSIATETSFDSRTSNFGLI